MNLDQKANKEIKKRMINTVSDPIGASPELNTISQFKDKFNSISTSAMLARSNVPESHRKVADSYMVIKKIFGFPAVQSKMEDNELKILARFDFNPLEYSTIKQINEELAYLKRWSDSTDFQLKMASDKIIEIRSKELKRLIANRYVDISSEVYNGFKALERYFEDISKYSKK